MELGQDSLQNRRQKKKLLYLNKTISGDIPNYITADLQVIVTTNNVKAQFCYKLTI